MYPRVAEYVPSDLPVLLTATILEAIPALLEQHDRYDQIQLTEYLAQVFPEIPEVLRGPVVVAATAGARQAALMHGICEKNTLSEDPRKRRFAAEAASSLSFWALGLRAPHRSAIAVPCARVLYVFVNYGIGENVGVITSDIGSAASCAFQGCDSIGVSTRGVSAWLGDRERFCGVTCHLASVIGCGFGFVGFTTCGAILG